MDETDGLHVQENFVCRNDGGTVRLSSLADDLNPGANHGLHHLYYQRQSVRFQADEGNRDFHRNDVPDGVSLLDAVHAGPPSLV